MKKFFASIVLMFALVVPSFASFQSVVLSPAGALLAFASSHISPSLTAAGLYFGMLPGASSSTSASGTVSRPADAQWVDLTMAQPTVQHAPITADIPIDAIKSIVGALDGSGATNYPLLSAAVGDTVSTGEAPSYSTIMPKINYPSSFFTGPATFSAGGHNYHADNDYYMSPISVTGVADCGNQGGAWADPAFMPVGANCVKFTNFGGPNNGGSLTPDANIPPGALPTVRRPKSSAEVLSNLAAGGAAGTVSNNFQSELDKMLKDDNYVPTFTDSRTGQPFVKPANIATPAQVDAYNIYGTAHNPSVTTTTSPTTIANNGDGTSTGTKTTTVSGGAGGSTSTTTTTQYSGPDGTGTKTGTSTTATTTAPNGAPGIAYGDGTTSDFGKRMKDFSTTMKTSGLFSLSNNIIGTIPGGGTSVFNLDFGRFGKCNYDLAVYSTSFALIKSLVLVSFSVAALKIVLLKGGGG